MKAILYKPAKSIMQYGDDDKRDWVLEYEKGDKSIDPMTGWTSSSNTDSQIHIKFKTREAAIAFAERNQIAYEVIERPTFSITPNVYSSNFK